MLDKLVLYVDMLGSHLFAGVLGLFHGIWALVITDVL